MDTPLIRLVSLYHKLTATPMLHAGCLNPWSKTVIGKLQIQVGNVQPWCWLFISDFLWRLSLNDSRGAAYWFEYIYSSKLQNNNRHDFHYIDYIKESRGQYRYNLRGQYACWSVERHMKLPPLHTHTHTHTHSFLTSSLRGIHSTNLFCFVLSFYFIRPNI